MRMLKNLLKKRYSFPLKATRIEVSRQKEWAKEIEIRSERCAISGVLTQGWKGFS